MDLRVYDTAEEAAIAAADWLASALADAVAARGRASLALSGGRTPWRMLETLDSASMPWSALSVYQVDERAVAIDDERRNGQRIAELLVGPHRLAPDRFKPMPAEQQPLAVAAATYATLLEADLGSCPVLDVVQLGLGADAHTASLIPGDPLLEVTDQWVGVSGMYQGTQRLSLTFPVLNAARFRLWLVTGADKVDALHALMAGDRALPCGRVTGDDSVIFADAAAAKGVRA
jgi:6-phosphogluconolactonase